MPRILLVAALVCGACHSPTPAPSGLRIATWNIHHGRGLDGEVDLDRIAAVIRALDADVVALQEVDRGVARTDRLDLPAELARRTGMTAAFGKNLDYQGGDYGNALLTRWPVLWQRNHHYAMFRQGEQRGLLQVGLDTPLGPVAVLVTHLGTGADGERLAHVVEIERVLDGMEEPVVLLCGDFNDLPGSRTHAAVLRRFSDTWGGAGRGEGFTFRSDEPRRRIDWVLVQRDSPVKPVRAAVHATLASDHLPLVVDLDSR